MTAPINLYKPRHRADGPADTSVIVSIPRGVLGLNGSEFTAAGKHRATGILTTTTRYCILTTNTRYFGSVTDSWLEPIYHNTRDLFLPRDTRPVRFGGAL